MATFFDIMVAPERFPQEAAAFYCSRMTRSRSASAALPEPASGLTGHTFVSESASGTPSVQGNLGHQGHQGKVEPTAEALHSAYLDLFTHRGRGRTRIVQPAPTASSNVSLAPHVKMLCCFLPMRPLVVNAPPHQPALASAAVVPSEPVVAAAVAVAESKPAAQSLQVPMQTTSAERRFISAVDRSESRPEYDDDESDNQSEELTALDVSLGDDTAAIASTDDDDSEEGDTDSVASCPLSDSESESPASMCLFLASRALPSTRSLTVPAACPASLALLQLLSSLPRTQALSSASSSPTSESPSASSPSLKRCLSLISPEPTDAHPSSSSTMLSVTVPKFRRLTPPSLHLSSLGAFKPLIPVTPLSPLSLKSSSLSSSSSSRCSSPTSRCDDSEFDDLSTIVALSSTTESTLTPTRANRHSDDCNDADDDEFIDCLSFRSISSSKNFA